MSIRFRKDRDKWEVSRSVGGRRRSALCKTKKEALEIDESLRRKQLECRGIDSKYSIADAFASFLETESAQKTKASRAADKRSLDIMLQFFNTERNLFYVAQVGLEDLQRLQIWSAEKLGWSDTTIALRMKLLRGVFKKLTIMERIKKNPAEHWKIPPGNSMRRRAMTGIEFEKLIQSDPSSWLLSVLLFTRLTGARGASVAALRWSDVDFSTASLLLSSRKSGLKKLKTVSFPIYPELFALLSSLSGQPGRHQEFVFVDENGMPLTGRKISWSASRLIKRAGLKGVVFYGLRHAIATDLIAAGISTEIARKVMGHSSLDQIQTYTQGVGLEPIGNALTLIRGGKKANG